MHGNGGLNPRFNPLFFQCILECDTVNNCCEHSHVVGRSPVHVVGTGGDAAEDVPPADHDGHLELELAARRHLAELHEAGQRKRIDRKALTEPRLEKRDLLGIGERTRVRDAGRLPKHAERGVGLCVEFGGGRRYPKRRGARKLAFPAVGQARRGKRLEVVQDRLRLGPERRDRLVEALEAAE